MLDTEHYAIIEISHMTIPGDERSRTNPGHGYPEHTVENITYRPLMTKEEVLAWIKRCGERTNYKIIKAQPLTLNTEIALVEP